MRPKELTDGRLSTTSRSVQRILALVGGDLVPVPLTPQTNTPPAHTTALTETSYLAIVNQVHALTNAVQAWTAQQGSTQTSILQNNVEAPEKLAEGVGKLARGVVSGPGNNEAVSKRASEQETTWSVINEIKENSEGLAKRLSRVETENANLKNEMITIKAEREKTTSGHQDRDRPVKGRPPG